MNPTNEENERALQAAWKAHIDGLLTEPMSIGELADYWGLNRNKMSSIVRHMPDAERCGGQWRIPVRKMPPRYHREQGLIPPN